MKTMILVLSFLFSMSVFADWQKTLGCAIPGHAEGLTVDRDSAANNVNGSAPSRDYQVVIRDPSIVGEIVSLAALSGDICFKEAYPVNNKGEIIFRPYVWYSGNQFSSGACGRGQGIYLSQVAPYSTEHRLLLAISSDVVINLQCQ